jgi:hypothetical protein
VERSRQLGLGQAPPFAAMIKGLIESDKISAARRLVPLALRQSGDSPEVMRLAAALRPPSVTTVPRTDTSRTAEFALLSTLRQAYTGQWVALAGGALVGAKPALSDLLQELKQHPTAVRPLLYRFD